MEQVKHRLDNNTLYIALCGHIDSTNAPAVEEAVMEIRRENPAETLVLDADRLEYISSAGLRVVLRLRKAEASLSIINVSPEIYEVLDMTGFTDMIRVERAYRRISVDGCEIIGRGANGAIYRYDAETIVKIYHNPDSLEEIRQEREMARKAFVLGISTAIPYGIVRVGEGYGTATELLNASSVSKLVADRPEKLEEYTRLYIDLLRSIHSIEVEAGEMPAVKETVLGWVAFMKEYLDAPLAEKLCRLVAELPDRRNVLHGDYHTNNVMVQNGEPLIIDMDTLCYGHPIFELASMYNAFVGFSELDPGESLRFLHMPHDLTVKIWETSLRLYLDTDDAGRLQSVENKARVIGYTRMLRRSIRRGGLENEESLVQIRHWKAQLERLLAVTDSLDF